MKKVLIVAGLCVMGFCVFPMMLGVVITAMSPAQPRKAVQAQPVQPVQASPPKVSPKLEGYDPSKKAEREELINKMIKAGAFSNLRMNGKTGHVVCGRKFLAEDHASREKFAGLIMAWCLDQDQSCTLLVFHDPKTDDRIGTFSTHTGFTMSK